MKPTKLFFAICLIGIALSACLNRQKAMPEKDIAIQEAPRVWHPRFRESPYPAAGKTVKTNPPILLIPLEEGKKNKHFSFRLSTHPEFQGKNLQEGKKLPYAIYHPHKALANGDWYWQYKYEDGPWSDTQHFKINSKVAVFETPSLDELVTLVPESHPRVLVYEKDLQAFRLRNKDHTEAKKILALADNVLRQSPPKESEGLPVLKGTTKVENEKLAQDGSKKLGTLANQGLTPLVQAYLLTDRGVYAKAAIIWALEVASWDPNGVSMVNNFADSECMLMLATTFDACYNLLTEEEKTLILKSIQVRGNRFYASWRNSLEAKVFSAHVWQHILERLFKTSLATLNEIPEAKDWLALVYDLWQARSPVLGPDDGGWWNGTHYFELNTLTLLDIPMILNSLTGIDFLRSPFYENNPYWLIYSFPPLSYSDGFGNGTEKQFGQKTGVLGYADALSRLKGNPYAAWYADQHLAAMGLTLADDPSFRWFRLRWELPARPSPLASMDLPLARVFPETGTVNMHSDLENPLHNLMVSLRSSPYGSTSHAHADQNAFNIQYGGKKLFYTSGYRPSMGVPHYNQWFKATKGHNTVLIDGKEQPIASAESYGWIPRFLHGQRISYVLGDASKAYDNSIEKPQQAGLQKFRRHMAYLRPGLIVIYDELAADHPADWSWLLHSMEPTRLDESNGRLFCETDNAKSQVDLFGSSPIDISISTKFDPAPVNFRGMRDEDGDLLVYKDQWHITAANTNPTGKMRFLAIIQVAPKESKKPFSPSQKNQEGIWEIGDWRIQASLDENTPPALQIEHKDQTAILVYGKENLQIGTQKIEGKGLESTILAELIEGEWVRKEATDTLPKGRN
ncbi:MAG: DUF4962 domain-containing protein [Saprospiraceae bacterium]